MDQNQPIPQARAIEIMNDKMAQLGPDFTLGLNVDRIWATGVQAFPGPEFTLVVFRDQSLMPTSDNDAHLAIKNVASIILPTSIAREFSKSLEQAFSQWDTQGNGGE